MIDVSHKLSLPNTLGIVRKFELLHALFCPVHPSSQCFKPRRIYAECRFEPIRELLCRIIKSQLFRILVYERYVHHADRYRFEALKLAVDGGIALCLCKMGTAWLRYLIDISVCGLDLFDYATVFVLYKSVHSPRKHEARALCLVCVFKRNLALIRTSPVLLPELMVMHTELCALFCKRRRHQILRVKH